MLRSSIYFIKRLLHNNHALYRAVYWLLTLNFDSIKQTLSATHYPSSFGGMWTDRDDYPELKNRKLATTGIDRETEGLLDQWREQGYVILNQAISEQAIDLYLNDLERHKNLPDSPLLVASISSKEPTRLHDQSVSSLYSARIVDDYFYLESSRSILMHKPIMDFIELVFERRPMLNQSLSFELGSEQAIHQDTAFVRMNSPMKLAAIWVALEDVQPGSGELVYYPGSHRWEDFYFSRYFKHYDEERDGPAQLEQFYQWIHRHAEQQQGQLTSFLPQKGDVLIWHAGLAHGGAKVIHPGLTRRSLVGHYCPEGVRPLYHYYKPGQRKRYSDGEYRYCSSYYSGQAERPAQIE